MTNITDSIKNNEGLKKLQYKFNEDPISVLLVGAVVVTAAAKLLDSVSAAQGRKAYAKQINYKTRK